MSNYGEDELSSNSMEFESPMDDEVEEESSLDSSDNKDTGEEDIDVWSKIQDEAMKRHDEEYNELLEKHLADGDNEEVATIKAENALVPTYRKEFRQVLFEELKWIHNLKKEPIYKKIVETKNNFVLNDDYDWEEAMESAINKRKYLLKGFFENVALPKKQPERFHPYKQHYGSI